MLKKNAKEKKMTKKKNLLGMLVMALVLGMTVVSCTTTEFVLYTDNSGKDFTILGEVTYKANTGGHQGLIDFLAEARKQYPDTDYVIDIMVDGKKTSFLFFHSSGYVYRGTAIKYK
jgi:hypothetical protein